MGSSSALCSPMTGPYWQIPSIDRSYSWQTQKNHGKTHEDQGFWPILVLCCSIYGAMLANLGRIVAHPGKHSASFSLPTGVS